MAVRILEKNGVDNTNIDGAGFNKFSAGGYSGVIKGILNELSIAKISSNVVSINTGELLINGFRLVVNEAIPFTMGVVPSERTNYRIVAEIVVDSESEVTTRFFIQQSNINLTQNNLFATESGTGTYQLSLATFDYSSDGIENLVTDFKILDNDYKTYVNNLLVKKVGVETQQFSEEEKRIARENIGAVSSAQLEDNVKYVYIVGSTPLDNDWFSDSPSGTPITPENEIIYIVKTAGDYYNKQYIFNSSTNKYELTNGVDLSDYVPKTRKINNKELTSDITLDADDINDADTTNKFVTSADKTNWNNKENKAIEESYTITSNSWVALSSSEPYTFSTTVTATQTIGNDTEVGIVNDQPILFANYGFVVGAVSGQSVIIYALKQPSSSVTLTIGYRG